jgi:hypothetical protein
MLTCHMISSAGWRGGGGGVVLRENSQGAIERLRYSASAIQHHFYASADAYRLRWQNTMREKLNKKKVGFWAKKSLDCDHFYIRSF